MILGITGTNGSGKGAVVDHLVAKGFVHFSVRNRLEEALNERGIPVTRPALREYANSLRKEHGAGYFIQLILEEIAAQNIPNAVIESIRTMGEFEYLKSKGAYIIAVDADRRVRFARIKRRASHTDHLDFETFVMEEEREWHGAEGSHDMNMMKVIARADAKVMNEGTLEELHTVIDVVLARLGA